MDRGAWQATVTRHTQQMQQLSVELALQPHAPQIQINTVL